MRSKQECFFVHSTSSSIYFRKGKIFSVREKSRLARVHFSFPIKNQDFYILHLQDARQIGREVWHKL